MSNIPKKAFSKTKLNVASSCKDLSYSSQISKYRSEADELKAHDTPAPRARPPKPAVYESQPQKSKSLLHTHIRLSSLSYLV